MEAKTLCVLSWHLNTNGLSTKCTNNPGALTPKSTHRSPLVSDILFTVWSKAAAPKWRVWCSPVASYRNHSAAAAFPRSESLQWEPQSKGFAFQLLSTCFSLWCSWQVAKIKEYQSTHVEKPTDSSSLWVHRKVKKKGSICTKVSSLAEGCDAQWPFIGKCSFLSPIFGKMPDVSLNIPRGVIW